MEYHRVGDFCNCQKGKQPTNNQTLNFYVQQGLSTPVIIHVVGKVPSITTTQPEAAKGIKLTYYDSNKDRSYYRASIFDNDDYRLDSKTGFFTVAALAEESYKERLSMVQDKTLRDITAQLHDKGLVSEADQLLDYYSAESTEIMLPLWQALLLLGLLDLYCWGGLRLAYTREHNAQEKRHSKK